MGKRQSLHIGLNRVDRTSTAAGTANWQAASTMRTTCRRSPKVAASPRKC